MSAVVETGMLTSSLAIGSAVSGGASLLNSKSLGGGSLLTIFNRKSNLYENGTKLLDLQDFTDSKSVDSSYILMDAIENESKNKRERDYDNNSDSSKNQKDDSSKPKGFFNGVKRFFKGVWNIVTFKFIRDSIKEGKNLIATVKDNWLKIGGCFALIGFGVYLMKKEKKGSKRK